MALVSDDPFDPFARSSGRYAQKQDTGGVSGGGRSIPGPTTDPPPTTPVTAGTFDFSTPAYAGPMSPDMSFWKNAPNFVAPQFTAPTDVTMKNDPGYQFRLNQGLQALQQSAAAQGLLRTGGTLKNIEDYGQNTASQEYQNVYNRALQNFQTQYTGAKDMYAPKLASWQLQMGFGQQDALAAFQRAWDAYTFPISNTTQNAAIAASIQPPPAA